MERQCRDGMMLKVLQSLAGAYEQSGDTEKAYRYRRLYEDLQANPH